MVALICGIFCGIWRRCFGSSGWHIKILEIRAVQHAIGFLGIACFLITKYSLWQALIVAGVMQGIFWSRSHGCCFDFGHGTPDPKRYDEMWYWKYLKKYIPEGQWYGFNCDYYLMNIRYSIPSVLVGLLLFSVPAMFMGFALAGMYALCWIAYDFGWIKNPTSTAEYLGGFITGLLLML